MKISRVIDFLESTREREGEIEVQNLAGMWVHTIPATGERVAVLAVTLNVSPREEK